jgi:hypothetical protein
VVLREKRLLLLRIDAVGYGVEQKAVGDGNDGGAHGLGVLARVEVRDERRADFQHIERKLLQVADTQMAIGEIVDRESHADVSQRPEAFSCAPGVVHQDTLGELELDEIRIYGVRLQHAAKRFVKIRLPELTGGHVDADARDRRSGALPAFELTAHLFDHPHADRNDAATFLGRRHELAGAKHSTLGVLPMRQRFDGFDTVICKAHLRLVQKHELSVFDRGLETGLEP